MHKRPESNFRNFNVRRSIVPGPSLQSPTLSLGFGMFYSGFPPICYTMQTVYSGHISIDTGSPILLPSHPLLPILSFRGTPLSLIILNTSRAKMTAGSSWFLLEISCLGEGFVL